MTEYLTPEQIKQLDEQYHEYGPFDNDEEYERTLKGIYEL